MKHEGKIRLINKNKKACLSLLLAALMIFSNAQAGFCQGWFSKREDNSKTWENIQSEIKALKEKVAQQEQMQSELSVLQEKVVQLENTVKEQAALIADQRKALDRILAGVASAELEKKVQDQSALIQEQGKKVDRLIENAPSEVKAQFVPPEPKMLVQKFVINGANLFTAKEFEPVLNQYRDKDLTMTELKKAADELTALYRKNGYLTCMVYLPPQDITNNTVEFKVVEGKVGNIKIEEPKYTKVKNIENKFLIEKGQILNTQQLQANLHRINKPDRTMRAVLSPGADKDTTDILLKIEQEKPHNHFSVDINNRGTKDTGLLRWGLNYMNTSLLGNDDILTLKYEDNIRHHVYSASAAYEIPVSRYNTRLGAYVAYSKADINGQFAVLSPNGVGTFAGFYVSHPWLDKEIFDDTTNSTLSMRSNLTAGFDAISVRNKILGEVTSNDQLRVLKGGLNFEETDKYGRGGLTGEIQLGIPGFLGSMGRHDVKASRIDAGGEFQKYNLSFTRVTSLPASSMLINLFKGQYSPNCLATVEQMIFGGADSIRGYPEADYLADYGWMTTAELRTPFFLLPPELKVPFDKKRTSLTEAIQMLLFVDGGIGYLNGARSGELSSKQLVSVGFGFRANFYDHLRGRLDIGFPVGDDASDKSNGTVHFGIEYDW